MAVKTALILGDVHLPWGHGRSLKSVIELADQKKPDLIIQIGDLRDMFSFGRFPRSFNHLTPKQEIERGTELANDLWFRLKKSAPKAKCFQLLGNHDERLHKKTLVSFPESEEIMGIKDLFRFKGVETMNSERDELIIDDVLYMHGFRSKLGDHARHNGMKTVCGHSHQGGVVYLRLGDKTIWELNAGFLADASSPALSYTRQRRISNWTLGCGYIDELGPRFIPFKD